MANVVGDIAIQVGADIGPLVTGLGRAQAAVGGFGKAASGTATGAARALGSAFGAVAVAATTAGLGLAALTKQAIDQGGQFYDASLKVGVHVAQLQAMAQVANEAGVSTDGLTSGIVRMQKSIAELRAGTGAQTEAFAALGIGIQDLASLSPDRQFALLAERIEAIRDPAERTAAAMSIFGKSGADLIPMMQDYAATVADVAERQRDMGVAMTDEQAAQMDAAGDAMARMQGALQGLGTQLAVAFAPSVTEAAEALAEFIAYIHTTDEEITAMATEITLDNIATSAAAMGDAAETAAASMMALGNAQEAQTFQDIANNIDLATQAFEDGAITVDEYKAKLAEANKSLIDLYNMLNNVDGTDMSDAIAEMSALGRAIGITFDAAKRLAGILPGGGTVPSGPSDMESDRGGRVFTRSDLAPTNSPRPGRPGIDSPIFGDDGGGGGGGGGGRDMAAELEALRATFQTEQQVIEEQYQERLAKLEEFRQAKMITEAEYNDLEKQATQDHAQAIADIEQQARAAKLQALSGMFGDFASLMSSHNEKTFRIGKAAAIAEAVVDGYAAATSAWKKGMAMGGPGVAAAFTAASLARTGAMIANINRTQIGGASQPSSGGAGGAVSAPASPLEVRLTGFGPSDLFSGDMIGSLLDRLGAEAGDRGYKIMVAA